MNQESCNENLFTALLEASPIKITIDEEKCHFSLYDPTGCKKCLEICPVVVFGCVPAEKRRVGVAPTIYKPTVVWGELCNGCGACIRVCPTNAITIEGIPLK